NTGTSPELYLRWAYGTELRALGHRLLGTDPRQGYAFEMDWRRLCACGDRAWCPEYSNMTSFLGELRREAEALRTVLNGTDAIHCVYQRSGDAIVRWTAMSGRVECDTLAAPSDSVAAWVATVRRRLDAAAVPDAEFLTTSARLAHVLLPHEALEPSSTRRLLFSGDDLLAQFPLCALSVSPNRYEPL